MATFGNTTVQSTPSGGSSGTFWAYQATMPGNGTITSVSAYCSTSLINQNVQLVVYADNGGTPSGGALLGETATVAATSTPGWVTANLETPYDNTGGSVL